MSSTMDTATLPFVELVVILQTVLPFDLFPFVNSSFCLAFRNRHDGHLTVGEFVGFLSAAIINLPEHNSVMDRLVGQLAMRKVGSYDGLATWLINK